MSNNKSSPEKRIATDQTLLRLRGVESDDLTPGVLPDVHDVFEEHGLSLESTAIEPEGGGFHPGESTDSTLITVRCDVDFFGRFAPKWGSVWF